jgi:hypothetical protein
MAMKDSEFDASWNSVAFSDDDKSGEVRLMDAAESKENAAQHERQTIGRQETAAVSRLRVVVLGVLLLTAILVSLGVFFYTRNDETQDFVSQFDAQAARVIDQFHANMERTLQTMDGMSVATTSFAKATGQTFPNVTIPDFIFRGSSARVLSEGLFFAWAPLVTDDTRSGWEAYAAHAGLQQSGEAFVSEFVARTQQNHKFGLNVSIPNVEGLIPDRGADSDFGPAFKKEIWSFSKDDDRVSKPVGSGPYAPVWQISPSLPVPNLLNLNMLDLFAFGPTLQSTLDTGLANIADYTDLQNENVEVGDRASMLFGVFVFLGQFRADVPSYANDPFSPLMYPVFDTLQNGNGEKKLVGVFLLMFYWRLQFTNVLPDGGEGVICVLENTQGQEFSFRLDGPDVTYLGAGDRHDAKHNDLEHYANVAEYLQGRAGPETRSYTAIELNPEFNNYKLRVYPSQSFQDAYVTNKPAIYTVVAAFIFFVTSCIFLLYDYLVERRQKVVMDKAVKSSAVVSSLFPEKFRDRLLNEGDDTKSTEDVSSSEDDKDKNNWLVNGPNHMMKLDNDTGASMITSEQAATRKGKPIADRFLDSSVMFADLAGFTQWAASRQPDEVFELLESLYVSPCSCDD